jgi:hypothetical protein
MAFNLSPNVVVGIVKRVFFFLSSEKKIILQKKVPTHPHEFITMPSSREAISLSGTERKKTPFPSPPDMVR